MERKRRQKRYRRLDRAERAAIQNGLERGWSCRRMARELGRSPSTVADEVAGEAAESAEKAARNNATMAELTELVAQVSE